MAQENKIKECNENNQNIPRCDSRVKDSTTLNECENQCNIPTGRTGPLIAKIPVVLSDVEVQIDLESEIRLEERALDIKNIDKHIMITQCKLIPYTNKLFIAGHVQKNIQFSTIDCTNQTSISGNIQHTTVNIPFKCVTKIHFSNCPIYGKEYKKRLNSLDNNMLNKDQKEDSWIHYNKLYEPVYCELEHARILETDILDRNTPLLNTLPNEKSFHEITEKMVVYLRLKVLQNQNVCIPEPSCEVTVVKDWPGECGSSKDVKCVEIEVGFDPERGMIGKEVPVEELDED